MKNTPDDWPDYFVTCPSCKRRYHASEGGCECEADQEDIYPSEPGYDPRDDDPYWDEIDDAQANQEAERYFIELDNRRDACSDGRSESVRRQSEWIKIKE